MKVIKASLNDCKIVIECEDEKRIILQQFDRALCEQWYSYIKLPNNTVVISEHSENMKICKELEGCTILSHKYQPRNKSSTSWPSSNEHLKTYTTSYELETDKGTYVLTLCTFYSHVYTYNHTVQIEK